MKKLTYKNVFSRYESSFTHILARKTYALYRSVRLWSGKWIPLKDFEKYRFEDHHLSSSERSDMPMGYDRKTGKEVAGRIELKYIDLFDYLPKEDIEDFRKRLHRFVLKNKCTMFSSYRTAEDDSRISDMGRYVDGQAFAKLHTVEVTNNLFLQQYAPQVAISIYNLSASFTIVKYRLYVSEEFNKRLNIVYCNKYEPYSDVSRRYDIPWYKPWKFGRAMYKADNGRTQAVYSLISELKWNAYTALKKHFRLYFGNDYMFPPTFETYSTNIQAESNREKHSFWDSIGLDYNSDYSIEYNACVSWRKEYGKNEGMVLKAFCGGNYKDSDYLSEIAEHDLSDIYGVYMVASTIRRIAERDIAKWNVKMSNAVRQKKTFRLLNVRSQVDEKLYYSYRFLSEFSGETLEINDGKNFRNQLFSDSSMTKKCFESLSSWIIETKEQVDILRNLLNNAADIQASKSNMKMQWLMMIITILSLIVAIVALSGFKIDVSVVIRKIQDIWVQIISLCK